MLRTRLFDLLENLLALFHKLFFSSLQRIFAVVILGVVARIVVPFL